MDTSPWGFVILPFVSMATSVTCKKPIGAAFELALFLSILGKKVSEVSELVIGKPEIRTMMRGEFRRRVTCRSINSSAKRHFPEPKACFRNSGFYTQLLPQMDVEELNDKEIQ